MKVSSKLPVPTKESTDLEKLQYEYAELYEAYSLRGLEVTSLETIISKYQKAFGAIESEMQGVLR